MSQQKIVISILLILTILIIEPLLEKKIKTSYVFVDIQIDNHGFFESVNLASKTYFSTSIIDEKDHDFSLSFLKHDSCQEVPFQLSGNPLYFCSTKEKFLSAQFNQLIATIDSPLVREYCLSDELCQLPDTLN